MQLKIADSVWWPVVIEVPADGGKVQHLEVEGKYRLCLDDDYAELMKRPQGELLAEVLLDWRVITDEADQPVPFTPENLAQLIKIRWALHGFVEGFIKLHNGAGRKN